MFTDVCMPDGNEGQLAAMAKKLETQALCFLYPGKLPAMHAFDGVKAFAGEMAGRGQGHGGAKGRTFLLDCSRKNLIPQADYIVPVFYAPKGLAFFRLDNKTMAFISSKKKTIIFPLSALLFADDRVKAFSDAAVLLLLTEKYSVDVAFASMARTPYELRSGREARSISYCLTRDLQKSKKAVELLSIKLSGGT